MSPEVTNLLQGLADRLGTTVEYLWGTLVRQAPIQAVTDSVYLIALGGLYWFLITRWRKFVKENTGYENEDSRAWFTAGIAIVGLICFLIASVTISGIVSGFLNPEYWALERILSLIKVAK